MAIGSAVLQVEELGQRLLPSVSPVALPLAAPADAAIVQHQHQYAGGQGHGLYTTGRINPDAGTEYHLYGTGYFAGLGNVDIAGDVQSVGFVLQGRAEGTMTFRNAHGTVTVELQGPTQGSFSPLPQTFYYQVTSSTGAYKHAHGHGTLQLHLTAVVLGHGTFTVTI